jgi:hypothetical protein
MGGGLRAALYIKEDKMNFKKLAVTLAVATLGIAPAAAQAQQPVPLGGTGLITTRGVGPLVFGQSTLAQLYAWAGKPIDQANNIEWWHGVNGPDITITYDGSTLSREHMSLDPSETYEFWKIRGAYRLIGVDAQPNTFTAAYDRANGWLVGPATPVMSQGFHDVWGDTVTTSYQEAIKRAGPVRIFWTQPCRTGEKPIPWRELYHEGHGNVLVIEPSGEQAGGIDISVEPLGCEFG